MATAFLPWWIWLIVALAAILLGIIPEKCGFYQECALVCVCVILTNSFAFLFFHFKFGSFARKGQV